MQASAAFGSALDYEAPAGAEDETPVTRSRKQKRGSIRVLFFVLAISIRKVRAIARAFRLLPLRTVSEAACAPKFSQGAASLLVKACLFKRASTAACDNAQFSAYVNVRHGRLLFALKMHLMMV